MKDKPLFSIIVCVDERSNFVLPTIKSIYQQAYPQIEVLVYYCNPDLNENTLITPLQRLPIRNNIHVLVDKSDTPIHRAEGIRRCVEQVHGDVVVFTKENAVFSNVDTVDTIMGCFSKEPQTDVMLLPNTLKGPIEIRPPHIVLVDQLLFNQPKRLTVFRTDAVRELLDDLSEDVLELLPEMMLLKAGKMGRTVKCCPSRKAAIIQKAAPSNAMNYHLYKRDALLILDEFFLQDMLQKQSVDEEEKIETYYAKYNYYCALYNVPGIESSDEIKKLEMQHLRKKLGWYEKNYDNRMNKRISAEGNIPKPSGDQRKLEILGRIAEKIYHARWQMGSILLLVLNLLVIKTVLFPDLLEFAQNVLFGGWIIVFALFVYACESKLRLKLQKLKKWLNS